MAAYDNVALAAPPNIASAGNYAQLLYDMMNNLPKQYAAGQDFQYQQRMRNLFANGVPTDAAGNPDYTKMLTQAIGAGGAATAVQAAPEMQKLQLMRQILPELIGGGGGGGSAWDTDTATATPATSPVRPTAPAAASPASITGPAGPSAPVAGS